MTRKEGIAANGSTIKNMELRETKENWRISFRSAFIIVDRRNVNSSATWSPLIVHQPIKFFQQSIGNLFGARSLDIFGVVKLHGFKPQKPDRG
jgi:hypothetical protein